MKKDIIEESTSLCYRAIITMPTLDGSLRICNDFDYLNQIAEFNCYPLPRVDDLIDQLGRAQFISMLHLTKGY